MTNEYIFVYSDCNRDCKHALAFKRNSQDEFEVLCGDGKFWCKPRKDCDDYEQE